MLGAAKTGARRAAEQLDASQRRHTWLGFPLAVAKKFSQDRAGDHASLIAYYGFFSLFPLLLVFVTILGFVLHGDPGLQTKVVEAAKRQFPSLSGYLEVGSIAGSGLALAIGLVTALWAGLGVTNAAQVALNSVWDVPVAERPNLWKSRLRGIGLLASLGTAILLSTAASALRGVGGPLGEVFNVAGIVAPLVLNVVLYLAAFQVLTTIHLTWREVLPGSVLAGIAWTVLQGVGSYLIRHQIAHASRLYGTFAVVIVLLAWIHLGAQVTLYAAEANVVWARKLWPRSLFGGAPTDADRRALLSQAREAVLPAEGDRPPSSGPGGSPEPPAGADHARGGDKPRS